MIKSYISRSTKTPVFLMENNYASIQGSKRVAYLAGAISRSIVDNDDLKITVCLMYHTAESLFQIRSYIIHRYYYAYQT